MQEATEPNLQNVFDQELHAQPAFIPEDLPGEWTVGQHKYIRVLASNKDTLDKKLTEFRELGISVLDFAQRGGFWVFKTMAPQ